MVVLAPGEKAVLKKSVRWSRKGITWAPYIRPSHAGQLEAQANLAEAAAAAHDRGMINIGGYPGAAGYVKATLSGKSTNPNYYAQKAQAAAERHNNVPQIVQGLRARAQALRGGAGYRGV